MLKTAFSASILGAQTASYLMDTKTLFPDVKEAGVCS